MITINTRTVLAIGDHILWENHGDRTVFGEYSVAVVERHGKIFGEDYYLKFPDNTIPQYMDKDTIRRNSTLIDKNKDPEYFL